jgi:hypothetical protein
MKITQELINNKNWWDILARGSFNWNLLDYNSKEKVNWVAIRWEIADWCIYHEDIWELSDFHWSDNQIAKVWSKFPKSLIRELVGVDDKAKASYRI